MCALYIGIKYHNPQWSKLSECGGGRCIYLRALKGHFIHQYNIYCALLVFIYQRNKKQIQFNASVVAFELLLSLKKFRGKIIWWRKYNTIGNMKKSRIRFQKKIYFGYLIVLEPTNLLYQSQISIKNKWKFFVRFLMKDKFFHLRLYYISKNSVENSRQAGQCPKRHMPYHEV